MNDIFKKKKDKLFNGMAKVFIITYDIPVTAYDELGRDPEATLDRLLRICRQADLKLYNIKCIIWGFSRTEHILVERQAFTSFLTWLPQVGRKC